MFVLASTFSFLTLQAPTVSDRDGSIASFSSSALVNPSGAPLGLYMGAGFVSEFNLFPLYGSYFFRFSGFNAGFYVKGVPTGLRVYSDEDNPADYEEIYMGEYAFGVALSHPFKFSPLDIRAGVSLSYLYAGVLGYTSSGVGISFSGLASLRSFPLEISFVAGPLGSVSAYASDSRYAVYSVFEFGSRAKLSLPVLKFMPVLGFGSDIKGQFYVPVGFTLESASGLYGISFSYRFLGGAERLSGVAYAGARGKGASPDVIIYIGYSQYVYGFSFSIGFRTRPKV